MENVGDRQDQKQGRQKHIGKNKMDHGETEGQKKEKADKQHGDQMNQSFVLHPCNLFIMMGEQLAKRLLPRIFSSSSET